MIFQTFFVYTSIIIIFIFNFLFQILLYFHKLNNHLLIFILYNI